MFELNGKMVKNGSNSFAALGSDSDDSNGEDEEEVIGRAVPADSLLACTATSSRGDTIASGVQPQRQAGGSVAMRIDPMVGLQNDKTVNLGLANGDIEACYRVIDALGKNPNLFKLPAFKKLRAALHPLIMEQLKSNYQATGNAFKDESDGKRGRKRRKRDPDEVDRETRAAALETEYINQTQLRAVRMQQLESLNEDGFDVPRVPDGVALLTNGSNRLMLTAGRQQQLLCDDSNPSSSSSSATISTTEEEKEMELRDPISCYICHKPYKKLHFFYHQLCPECAAFNYRYGK